MLDNPRMEADCQGNQPGDERVENVSTYHPNFWKGEKVWRLNQLLMANDLINPDYVIKPP